MTARMRAAGSYGAPVAQRYEQAPLRVAGQDDAKAAALVAGAAPPRTPARSEPVTETELPGRLTATDRDRLAQLWATARRDHRWGPVAQLLVWWRAGWVRTPEAARLLEVSVVRLEAHAGGAERAGISTVLGWHRRWHAPSLPDWWAGTATPTRTQTKQQLSRARAGRVRAAVAAGASWQTVADAEGVSTRTVFRDLRDTPPRERPRASLSAPGPPGSSGAGRGGPFKGDLDRVGSLKG